MQKTHLALDGPLNGEYITAAQAAANDYELGQWAAPSPEQAYLHVPTQPEIEADLEVMEQIALEEGDEIDQEPQG